MKRLSLALLIVLIGSAIYLIVDRIRDQRRSRPPNIVLIGIDTLRADALGCYGAGAGRTPAIDRLAEEGVVFDAAYATAGWTLPSFGSIMTGLYPPAHGATSDDRAIPEDIPTLAEQLSSSGYATAAFTGGGWVSEAYGFDQGFSRFDATGRPTTLAERVNRAATWLRERDADDDAPFFLFLHAYDAHDPYAPDRRPTPTGTFVPPPVIGLAGRLFDQDPTLTPTEAIVTAFTYPVQRPGMGHGVRQSLDAISDAGDRPIWDRWQEEDDFDGAVHWLQANYEAEVSELDAAVAKLRATLAESGALEDTILILVADHGEAFMEHGRLEHRHVDAPVVRVPLVAWLPERLRRSDPGRIADVVSGADILPTLLDYAGLRPSGTVQGRTLRRLLEGSSLPSLPAPSFVDMESRTTEASLRFGRHRLIVGGPRNPNSDGALFDVIADPGEQTDLAEREPALRKKLVDLLDTLRDQSLALGTRFSSGRIDALDPETRQRLTQLGYLGGDSPR